MITLDLAFSPAAADLIDAADEEGTRSRLERASSWECELKTWIEALREDRDDHYPEPVRACDSISLGISLLGSRRAVPPGHIPDGRFPDIEGADLQEDDGSSGGLRAQLSDDV